MVLAKLFNQRNAELIKII